MGTRIPRFFRDAPGKCSAPVLHPESDTIGSQDQMQSKDLDVFSTINKMSSKNSFGHKYASLEQLEDAKASGLQWSEDGVELHQASPSHSSIKSRLSCHKESVLIHTVFLFLHLLLLAAMIYIPLNVTAPTHSTDPLHDHCKCKEQHLTMTRLIPIHEVSTRCVLSGVRAKTLRARCRVSCRRVDEQRQTNQFQRSAKA